MKKLLKIALVLTLMFACNQTEAQIFKKLGDRISKKLEKKAEERLDRKTDEVADQAIDSIVGDERRANKKRRKKNKKASKNNDKESSNTEESDDDAFNLDSFGGLKDMMENMGKEVVTEDVYTFYATITMDQYSSSGPTGIVKQSLGKNAFLTEMSSATLVMDHKNEALITISEEKKEAQVMSLGLLTAFDLGNDNDDEEDFTPPTIINKPNTKNILGYTCKGVTIKHEDMTIDLWYTDQVNIDTSSIIEMAMKMPGVSKNAVQSSFFKDYGFVMQMDVVTKDNMSYGNIVKKIDQSPSTLNLKEYKIIKP